jgi:hypothetical protein
MEKNSEKEKLAKIKEILKETALSSTSHGIPNIVRSTSSILKVIWMACFIASTGFCSYLVVKSIMSYLDREVVTKISVIYENPSTFPTITLCNLRPFIGDAFEKLYLKNNQTLPKGYLGSDLAFHKYFLMTNIWNQDMSIKKELGLTKEDFIYNCRFNFQKCNMSSIEWNYNFFYGNCFTFNKQGIEKLTKSSKEYGLKLTLFVGKSNQAIIETTGVHLFIQNKSERVGMFGGFDVPTGQSTNLAINKVISKKLASPYSECIDDEEILALSPNYRKIKAAKLAYKQTDCFELCFSDNLYKKCKCHESSTIEFFSDGENCHSFANFNCLLEFNIEFFSQSIKEKCDCPLECNSVAYAITTSMADFPNQEYSNYLMNQTNIVSLFNRNNATLNADELKRSILEVNIYFDELKYTMIEEKEKMSLIDLISNCGGQMGLFLGVSFLSFIELVDLALQVFLILMNTNITKVVDSNFK